MDRNTIIGIILIGGIFFLFTIWNTPNKKQQEERLRIADSIAQVQYKEELDLAKAKKAKEIRSANSASADSSNVKMFENNYGAFAKAAEGKQEFYTIENELLKITISSKGGSPYKVQLKKYKTFNQQPLILFEGDSTVFGFNFYTQNNRTISTKDLFFNPTGKDTGFIMTMTDTSRSFSIRTYAGNDKYIEYTYILKPNKYKVDFKVKIVNMDSVISSNSSYIDLIWQMNARSQEREKKGENAYTSIYYKFFQGDVDELGSPKDTAEKSKDLRNKLKWVAFKQQFFSTVLIAGTNFENATVTEKNILDSSENLKYFKADIGVPYQSYKSQQIDFAFYFGPNKYQTLKRMHLQLEDLIPLGGSFLKWINRYLIIPVFNFLSLYIANFGIIILLLTLIIKLLMFPLTYRSYYSMAKMRVLKPQIDEINARIPADKAVDRQQATMQLYKKVGVNPLGGCLPLILQFPILYAMFRFFPSSIELRQQGFLWAHDLSTYDSIVSWTTNIPIITAYFGNHISLFNVLMTITTMLTFKMNNQANASSQQFPGMQAMNYVMPIIFMFVLNNFSAGLTYYYFLANLITIIQNEIFKRSIDEEKLLHQLNENKKKITKKSKFQSTLEEAAKRRGYKK